jgi:hypothetical protein
MNKMDTNIPQACVKNKARVRGEYNNNNGSTLEEAKRTMGAKALKKRTNKTNRNRPPDKTPSTDHN